MLKYLHLMKLHDYYRRRDEAYEAMAREKRYWEVVTPGQPLPKSFISYWMGRTMEMAYEELELGI